VGTRLRGIHSDDDSLLAALNEYSGYMIARGYKEDSVKYHLSVMANRSRSMILKGEYKPVSKFVVPLVTSLHPATTVLTKMVKESFEEASKLDNTIDLIFPKSTLLVAYSKLPNLQLLLCSMTRTNRLTLPLLPPSMATLILVADVSFQGFFIFQVCLPPFYARVFSQDT
jgi:hypothetical protein